MSNARTASFAGALLALLCLASVCASASDSCGVDGDCNIGRVCRSGHCQERAMNAPGSDAAVAGGSAGAGSGGGVAQGTGGDAAPGSGGVSGAGVGGQSSPEMVFFTAPGGSFWIDAYEASFSAEGKLGSADLDSDHDGKIADLKTAMAHARSHGMKFDDDPLHAGELDPNEAGVVLTTVAAVSAGFREPAHDVSFWQAASACANAGKRLCTGAEWRWACQGGELGNIYPYGNTFDGGTEANKDCWTKDVGPVSPTGTASKCVTPQGLWDMSGNVEEMADLEAGMTRLRGGWTSSNSEQTSCGFAVPAILTGSSDVVGFRCCKDP